MKSFLIIIASCLWGITGLFVSALTADGYSLVHIIAVRSAVTAAALALLLAVTDRKALKVSPRDLPIFAGMGIASFAAFNFFYFASIQRIGMGPAAVLLYTAPVFIMIMSRAIYHEKLTAAKLTAVPIAFAGCAAVSMSGGSGGFDAAGVIFGIASGFCYGLYSVIGRTALQKYKPLTVTLWTFIFSAAATVPVAVISGGWPALTLPRAGMLLLMAMVSGALTYAMYTYGLSGTEPTRASVLATFEPAVAAVCGMVFRHEPVTVLSVGGIILVLAAVVIISVGGRMGSAHEKASDSC